MINETEAWFIRTCATSKREVDEICKSPGEIIFCLYIPVMWMLVVWGLLGDGMMTKVPVAFIDNDKTAISREIGRAINSNRAIALESFNTFENAMRAMRKGYIYGLVVVPYGYSRDTLSGRGSSVSLYVDETRFAVAGTLQFEMSGIISALKIKKTATASLHTGNGTSGAQRIVNVVHSDFYALGNMQTSFLAFLGGALMPGVIMVSAMLGFVTAIIREEWRDSVGNWLKSAGGSFSAALLGKITPHFALYCFLFLFYMALFAGQGGFAPTGSLFVWFSLGALCLGAFAAMAILVTGLAPNWRSALVVASGYAAPALPFTGFSIPLDSMGEYVRAFSKCLPLTWFIQGQAQQWTLDAGLNHMGPTFTALFALFIIPLFIGYYFFKRKFGTYIS